jgi:peptide/nickel transport system permease protein
MGPFLLRRFALGAVTVIAVSAILFVALRLTGDPATLMAPMDASEADIAALRDKLGLDEPLYRQYADFWVDMAGGGQTESIRYQRPAIDLVWPFFLRTAELVIPAVLISAVLGIGLGLLAATHHRSWVDRLILIGALAGQAIPIFFLALLLMMLLSVKLRWLPVSGTGSIKHAVLPILCLVVYNLAVLVRLSRSSLLGVLGQDYIRTARAKGLSARPIYVSHALRNASLEVVSSIGMQLGALLSGVVVIETIFAWPGIGSLMYTAVLQRDFPLVMVGTMVICVVVVSINLLIDISYAYLDPRIKLS